MSKQWGVPVGVVIVIMAVIGFVYWQKSQTAGMGAQGFPPSVIASSEVIEEQWQPTLRSVGSLVAINGIDVSTEVNGIVSDIVFKSGEPVDKGQVLIRLDDSVDEAALEALRADRKLAEVQYVRASDLLLKKVTSKSEYDEAKAKFDAASALVKQQEAVIKRKVIRAPFSGLAGIRNVSLGQFIEAGNSIVGLQALDPIYVDYTLPERYYARIKPGQKVSLQLDALPEQHFEGEVSAVDSGISTGTRTLRVRATLSNSENLLRPGMFAEVVTETGVPQTVLTLPRTAISFNTYGNFVFIINESDKGMTVKRTAVETGEVRDGRVAVTGLEKGVKVVRAGLVKLHDGAPVKIDNQVTLNDAEITGE